MFLGIMMNNLFIKTHLGLTPWFLVKIDPGDGPIPYACPSPYLNQIWFIVTQPESNRTHFFINDIYVEIIFKQQQFASKSVLKSLS